MPILHVVASPRGGRSASLEVATAFLGAYRSGHPGVAVDTLDVWATDLPPFDGPALEAKYAGLAGRPLTDAQRSAWGQVRSLADRFRAADLIVMSVPMWNFGLPYRLKHLIDAVSQKDLLFAFDGGRPAGLLGGRRLVVIAARGAPMGGDFPEAEADHQVAYLRTWARLVGIEDVRAVLVEGTLAGPEADRAARDGSRAEAEALAAVL